MTPVTLDIPEVLLYLLYLRDACELETPDVPPSLEPTTDRAPRPLTAEEWHVAWNESLVADWRPHGHGGRPPPWHGRVAKTGLTREQLRAWVNPSRRALSLALLHQPASCSAVFEAGFRDRLTDVDRLVVNVIPVQGKWGIWPRSDRIVVSPERRDAAREYRAWLTSLRVPQRVGGASRGALLPAGRPPARWREEERSKIAR